MKRLSLTAALLALSPSLWAADAISGAVQRQPLNVSAILMFVAFVGATLGITYWASKTQSLCRGLLRRRWTHHRFPERPGDRR